MRSCARDSVARCGAQKNRVEGKREGTRRRTSNTRSSRRIRKEIEAPARAFDIVYRALTSPIEESLKRELDAIVDLGNTEATQNLIRNFFLAEKYKKGTTKAPAEKIVHAVVVGAGVMGSGIAQWLSSRGVTVILRDVSRELVDRGLANIEKIYGDAVKRGIMTDEKAKEGRARVIASTAHVQLRDVQFVVEAVRRRSRSRKRFSASFLVEAPKAIVATNTSALSDQRAGQL